MNRDQLREKLLGDARAAGEALMRGQTSYQYAVAANVVTRAELQIEFLRGVGGPDRNVIDRYVTLALSTDETIARIQADEQGAEWTVGAAATTGTATTPAAAGKAKGR